MKRVLLSILTAITICQSICGQDRFDSYEQMLGQEVIFFQTEQCFKANGHYAYTTNGKNFKPIKDASEYGSFDSVPVKVTNIIDWKKKRFLEIGTTLKTYYLILDDKINYLTFTRSITYWREHFNSAKSSYDYIRKDCPALNGRELGDPSAGGFYPILWNSVLLPTTIRDKVYYDCFVNGKKVLITEENLQSPEGYFISNKKYWEIAAREEAERKEKERLDSIADCASVCRAAILHTKAAEDAIKKSGNTEFADYASSKDTLVLFIYLATPSSSRYISNKYTGMAFGHEVTLPEEALVFEDKDAKNYVLNRGIKGVEYRKLTAQTLDLDQMIEFTVKIEQRTKILFDKLEQVHKLYDQKKVFIIGKDYSFSDYQFGLEMKFYNCFAKTIKYIEITISAYNVVNDLQRDDFGNHTKSVRCIGPLAKGESGTWDFDNLFWDDNDIIDRLEITGVKFTFMDNSILNYSGKAKVDQHSIVKYQDDIRKILDAN